MGSIFSSSLRSRIIAIGGLAITEGMTLDEIRHQIFPHPTVAEIFQANSHFDVLGWGGW